jgi:hypothetical protein
MSRSDERVTPEPRKKVKLDQNSDSYSGPAKKNISHNTEEKAQESNDFLSQNTKTKNIRKSCIASRTNNHHNS